MPRRYSVMAVAVALFIIGASSALGVRATEADASAAARLKACGELLPVNSEFVMNLSANWNTSSSAGQAFGLSFTFGDKAQPELVGEIPGELLGFAQCLHEALTDEPLELPET